MTSATRAAPPLASALAQGAGASRQRPPNFYASGGLERAAPRRRDEGWLAKLLVDERTRFVPVWRSLNLVRNGGGGDVPPAPAFLSAAQAAALLAEGAQAALLGLVGDVAHFAIEVPDRGDGPHDAALPPGGAFLDLRTVGPLLGRQEGALLAYARGLIHWHSRHRYCGACGRPTVSEDAGHTRRCTGDGCGLQHFPRTDPAVIMLVCDGDHVILGRQRAWPKGMHSVLAGFVEPGESLEDAVAREVLEEVGIAVAHVTYHSSQPWPFPASIMLGFTARALSRELRIQADELETARWYSRAELRRSPEDETFRLPRRDSIARRLIEDWLAEG
ncbi:MAG: NAD(+) diphosphatase [Rhodospirillaceae bacterium]|nr:NAD(+) diphosphatase [Rhodospirillaceae bacterium]